MNRKDPQSSPMKRDPKPLAATPKLRRRAEEQLLEQAGAPVAQVDQFNSVAEARRLLHELQVHQVELEMQNVELRHARDELEEALDSYTDLYDFAPVGYFTLSREGTIRQVNLTGSCMVGVERSRLVGRSFRSLVATQSRVGFDRFLQQVFSSQSKQSGEFELPDKDQVHHTVNMEAQCQLNGQACRIALVDITERKKSEELLRQNESLFHTLVEQAPLGVYVIDSHFRLLQVNANAMPVFKDIRPLIDRDFTEIHRILWTRRVSDPIMAIFRQTLETGEPYFSPEFQEVRKDTGTHEIYEWHIHRITLPSRTFGLAVFFNDITERVRAEAERREFEVLTYANAKLKQEIQRRQKIETSLLKTKKEQTRLLELSHLQKAKLRDLSRQILHAQEEERKRISRELHDVIAQALVGINVHVAALRKWGTEDADRFKREIDATQSLVEKSVEIVHQFSLELRPTVLDDLGLIPALQALMKNYMEETGVRVSLKVFAGIEQCGGPIRTALYRVIQESLTNVARHAKASQVQVSIHSDKDAIVMDIEDNGTGFEVTEGLSGKGRNRLGLLGMRERIEMVGGTFELESGAARHTTIRVRIPLDKKRGKKE